MTKNVTVPNTLNLTDLSKSVAANFGLTQVMAADITRFMLDEISDALASGAQVRLHQFGGLHLRHREPRMGRNPASGEPVQVPAHVTVKLVPSPVLLAKLNA